MYSPAPEDDRLDLEMSAFQQAVSDFSAMNLTYFAEWLQTLPDDVLLRLLPPDHYMFEGSGAVRQAPNDDFEGNLDNLLGHNTREWWECVTLSIDRDYIVECIGAN